MSLGRIDILKMDQGEGNSQYTCREALLKLALLMRMRLRVVMLVFVGGKLTRGAFRSRPEAANGGNPMRNQHSIYGFASASLACVIVPFAACSSNSLSESNAISDGGSAASTNGSQSSGGSLSRGGTGSLGETAATNATGGMHRWPEVTSLSEFLDLIGQTYCKRLFNCRRVSDDDVSLTALHRTVENCTALQRNANVRLRDRLELAQFVSAGEVVLNFPRVAACLDEVASCDMPSIGVGLVNDWPACRDVFRGTIVEGGSCLRSEQCAGNSFCDTTKCPGTCTPRPKEGEPCTEDNQCATAPGHVVCDRNTCRTIPIRAPAALGARCQGWEPGVSELIPCATGLWCDTLSSGIATCRNPIPTGDACIGDSDQCVLGSACLDDVCTAIVYGSSINEWTNFCDEGAGFVAVNGQCVPAGDGSEGAVCGDSLGYRERASLNGCRVGLYCHENVCKVPKKTGEPCVSGEMCEVGSCSIVYSLSCMTTSSCAGTCSNAPTCSERNLVTL
jgi:hypothetical protein